MEMIGVVDFEKSITCASGLTRSVQNHLLLLLPPYGFYHPDGKGKGHLDGHSGTIKKQMILHPSGYITELWFASFYLRIAVTGTIVHPQLCPAAFSCAG